MDFVNLIQQFMVDQVLVLVPVLIFIGTFVLVKGNCNTCVQSH